MICHMKNIFVWIFLIPHPTGYVFIWDFVPIFSVFTFFFCFRNRSIHLIIHFDDFYIDSSRLKCLSNCMGYVDSKS